MILEVHQSSCIQLQDYRMCFQQQLMAGRELSNSRWFPVNLPALSAVLHKHPHDINIDKLNKDIVSVYPKCSQRFVFLVVKQGFDLWDDPGPWPSVQLRRGERLQLNQSADAWHRDCSPRKDLCSNDKVYLDQPYILYIHTYLHTYVRTYIHTYIHTYVRTYIHTCIPTYVRTYVRTYIHTYIHCKVYIYIE